MRPYATYIFKGKQKNFLSTSIIERAPGYAFIQVVSNKRITGKSKEVSLVMWILSALFVLRFIFM